MSRRTPAVPIQRGEGADDASKKRMKAAIKRAKGKGAKRNRPRDMEGTPRFDQIHEQGKSGGAGAAPSSPAPEALSQDTQAALTAAAEATARAAASYNLEEDGEPEEEEELTLDIIQDMFGLDRTKAMMIESIAYPERGTDPQQRMRHAIERRCEELDIGQYFMNGFLSQKVIIVPPKDNHKGLSLAFRTVKNSLEVFVDRELAEEAAKIRKVRQDSSKGSQDVDVEMSKREYQRRSSEWALAIYIESYQDNQWPAPLKDNGDVNEDAMMQRLIKVRKLPSQTFGILSTNLLWFLQRTQDAIGTAALGNG